MEDEIEGKILKGIILSRSGRFNFHKLLNHTRLKLAKSRTAYVPLYQLYRENVSAVPIDEFLKKTELTEIQLAQLIKTRYLIEVSSYGRRYIVEDALLGTLLTYLKRISNPRPRHILKKKTLLN